MIKLGKASNNPFVGLNECLYLYHSSGKLSFEQLDNCWDEVKNDFAKRQMFFSLLFSFGDITNRQHNIFGKTTRDNGGNADREAFYSIIQWMWAKIPDQFTMFLFAGLFDEYSCMELLLRSGVKTMKGSRKVVEVYDMLGDEAYRTLMCRYIVSVLKGNNPFKKHLVCKFLSLPRLSKRQNHSRLLKETYTVMFHKQAFLTLLSEKMGWEVLNGYNFKGYRNYRKQYNQDLESVLFSTGKIKEFDMTEFITWLDKLPAGARSRVLNRLVNGKWDTQKEWFKFWQNKKETAQAEQRRLEDKIARGTATDEDKLKLKEVIKQAKVTTGANNFASLYKEICNGNVDALKLESFIQKVNLPYDSLVVIDDSGSMSGAPYNFATFLASVCLYKNPNAFGKNLLGFFASEAHFHLGIDMKTTTQAVSSWWRHNVGIPCEERPFIDPLKSFHENYLQIKDFCDAAFRSGGTHLTSLVNYFTEIAQTNPEVKDLIKSFPILTLISDGDLNNARNARESMIEFQHSAKEILGWEPFIVLIDVGTGSDSNFTGVPNMIHINGNPAQIEQFLTNMGDMDVADGYVALSTVFKSNRYDLVRHFTL